MTAPLSVIIPTLNSVEDLGPTLSAVYEGAANGLVAELIITDGGSTDDIAHVADSLGARLVTGPKGRGTQLANGADLARSDWLLFLHADTVLPDGWSKAVRHHINQTTRPGYFLLSFDQGGLAARLVAGWANLRSHLFGLPYGDQGLLVSRLDYTRVGGFAKIPLMEDVAIIRKLPRARKIPARVTTSAKRYQNDGWLRRGTRNLILLGLYSLGTKPETLAEKYR